MHAAGTEGFGRSDGFTGKVKSWGTGPSGATEVLAMMTRSLGVTTASERYLVLPSLSVASDMAVRSTARPRTTRPKSEAVPNS